MLELSGITAGYGHFTALWDVSLRVAEGEAVAVVGPNGAGKTTLLRVISGLIAPRSGRIAFEGAELSGHPAYDIVAHGIAHVPEGRRLFPGLTVVDNLKMGAFLLSARARYRESLERVYTLFPVLAERQKQRAGSMSGGEQQMLAIGRALMSQPKIILLDEPSLGLAPVMVLRVFDLIRAPSAQAGGPRVLAGSRADQDGRPGRGARRAGLRPQSVHGRLIFEPKRGRRAAGEERGEVSAEMKVFQ